MNNKNHLLLALLTLATPLAFAQKPLGVGDPAPRLQVDRWVKGAPIKQFEKGKIYVLDFWATWCVPCRMAMPHLSELKRKFEGKATFIGVDVYEEGPKEQVDKAVDALVKQMGDKMDYSVCRDGDDKYMATSWLKAAMAPGIPTAFVVDQNGNIADVIVSFIPKSEARPEGDTRIEKTLTALLEGTFDYKAAADRVKAEQDKITASEKRSREVDDLLKPANDALRRADYTKALEEMDRLLKDDPSLKPRIAKMKFTALIHTNEEKAVELARESTTSDMAMTIADMNGLSKKSYLYAAETLQKEIDGNPQRSRSRFQILAKAYFQYGNLEKAVHSQKQFVEYVKGLPKAKPEYVAAAEELLKKYEAALVPPQTPHGTLDLSFL